MAKFKVGDRVRVKRASGNTTGFGKDEFTAEITDAGVGDKPYAVRCYPHTSREYEGWFDAEELELIQDYQPITPKVGERYRVVKELPRYRNYSSGTKPGMYLTLRKVDSDGDIMFQETTGNVYYKKCLTTEYLELVEEPSYFTVPKNYFEGLTNAIQPGELYYTTGDWGIDGGTAEPIKQTIITKSMNFIKKLTQSAADKTLEKAGFINSCGELTGTGTAALTSLVFQEKKDALVKLAQEVIDEETK